MSELKERDPEGHREGYYDYESNGKRWSVVDFGRTMRGHPAPTGLFLGWEAMNLDDNNEMFRANSWDELKQLIS